MADEFVEMANDIDQVIGDWGPFVLVVGSGILIIFAMIL